MASAIYIGALSKTKKSLCVVSKQCTVYWRAHTMYNISTEPKNCTVCVQFFKAKPPVLAAIASLGK